MLWCVCDVKNRISNVLTCEWLGSLVDFIGSLRVSMEAHFAKLCLSHTRIYARDADPGSNKVYVHTLVKRPDCKLGRVVYCPLRVDPAPCNATDIDDMPGIAGDHVWDDRTGHVK